MIGERAFLLPQGFPAERDGFPATGDLQSQKAGISAAVASGMWQTDPAPLEENLNGVRCLRFCSPAPRCGTVIHFHGGGFRIGCPEQVGPFAARLAQHCAVDVVCPAYRLAPEYPFPAGLSDATAALAKLCETSDQPILISGDSAGGGIAASLAALCGQMAIHPAGLVLLSPWLDLTASTASYAANAASDPLFSSQSAKTAADLYLQGWEANDPLASPGLGPVDAFPPTFINVGSGEVLIDDSRAFHARLRAGGIPAQLQEIAGMGHVAVTRGADLPGSAETFAALAAFVRRVLD